MLGAARWVRQTGLEWLNWSGKLANCQDLMRRAGPPSAPHLRSCLRASATSPAAHSSRRPRLTPSTVTTSTAVSQGEPAYGVCVGCHVLRTGAHAACLQTACCVETRTSSTASTGQVPTPPPLALTHRCKQARAVLLHCYQCRLSRGPICCHAALHPNDAQALRRLAHKFAAGALFMFLACHCCNAGALSSGLPWAFSGRC